MSRLLVVPMEQDLLKQYIIDNTTVLNYHSKFNSYYDLISKGKEVLLEFLLESKSNSEQVKKFLEVFTDNEIYEVRKQFTDAATDLADKILMQLGYNYKGDKCE